jgi:hypothetical protein
MLKLPGFPFGVVATRTGGWSFVSGYGSTGGYVAVVSHEVLAPRLVRVVDLPVALAVGSNLTADGRYLLVAGHDLAGPKQAVVLSVGRLAKGLPRPVLGVLKAPLGLEGRIISGAIQVTPDLLPAGVDRLGRGFL